MTNVRFSSSSNSQEEEDNSYIDTRRPSLNTAIEQTISQTQNQRGSNASSQSDDGGNQEQQGPTMGYNTAIAANDGPSLAMALTQSIRHHSKMIDGEQVPNTQTKQGGVVRPHYDPYNDDDHVSLAPGVELNYEKEAKESYPPQQEQSMIAPVLRDYIANAGVEDPSTKKDRKGLHHPDNVRTVEQQQGRVEERLRSNAYDSFTTRFTKNITNWFGLNDDDDDDDDARDEFDTGGNVQRRSVRFADDGSADSAVIAAAIANGEAVPGSAFGRAPNFVVPPPTSFRTATRHPSQLPTEFDNIESRLNAPRRILAARKRHRRNDSFLRLVLLVLCFALSLTFAIIYGGGQFGLSVTNAAYERKVMNQYGVLPEDPHAQELIDKENIFYPDWWFEEKGIPDMESLDIKFNTMIEYSAADVSSKRAPDRIETPFFWFIKRSGGNVIRTIMRDCLRLVEASELGLGSDQPYLVVEENDDKKYVNVDMTTPKGLARAKDLNIAASGVADVIISPDIHGVLDLFNNRNRARMFAVIRHPMERAISKYYADLASDPEVAGMTLPQYIRSGGLRVENNYLTRYLSGRYGGKLGVEDLNLAREFLRRKFVVGLATDLPATANLFSHIFGWNNTAAALGLQNVDVCYNNVFSALKNTAPPSIEEGSEGWKLLVAQNWFDLKVYEYAEHLFAEQIDQLKLTTGAITQGEIGRQ